MKQRWRSKWNTKRNIFQIISCSKKVTHLNRHCDMSIKTIIFTNNKVASIWCSYISCYIIIYYLKRLRIFYYDYVMMVLVRILYCTYKIFIVYRRPYQQIYNVMRSFLEICKRMTVWRTHTHLHWIQLDFITSLILRINYKSLLV